MNRSESVDVSWASFTSGATVQVAVPYILFARALRAITAQEAALITLIEPVLNPLWVLVVWHQEIATHTFIGGGFILAALLLRYLELER